MMSHEEGMMFISPKTEHHIKRERTKQPFLTKEEVDAIIADKKRIYVFGKIVYKDIFDIPHDTGFCHMYSGVESIMTDFQPAQAMLVFRQNTVINIIMQTNDLFIYLPPFYGTFRKFIFITTALSRQPTLPLKQPVTYS